MATTFSTTPNLRTHRPSPGRSPRRPGQSSALSFVSETSFVSATSWGVEAEVRGLVRPKVPNYAIRRVVVGAAALVLAVVSLVGAVGVLAGIGSSPASAASVEQSLTGNGAPASIHVAQPGDTLWSIANTYRGDVSRDRYIEVLIRMNGDTGVIAGEAIWLP